MIRYNFALDYEPTEIGLLAKEILMNREIKPYLKMKMALGYFYSRINRGR